MAEKIGGGIIQALSEKPVDIHIESKEKKKTTSTTKKTPKAQEHVLLAGTERKLYADQKTEAISRFTNLGLGRGIDATRSKPWAEKTTFQVRHLKWEGLIGTEEGGSVEAYEDVVSSVQTLQLQMETSVTAPASTPISIGVDGEQSRTVSASRRIVGRRVINRTIAFSEDFEEVPLTVVERERLRSLSVAPSPEVADDGGEDVQVKLTPELPMIAPQPLFEERLCKWILEIMYSKGKIDETYIQKLKDESSITIFREFYQKSAGENEEDIMELCYTFVTDFNVTHYVSAISLGALEYSVMTEDEYTRSSSQSGSFGLENLVSVALKVTQKKTKTRKYSHLKKVGLIKDPEKNDYYVARGSYAEAVTNIVLKPTYTLINHIALRKAFQKSTNKYIERQKNTSAGPFYIVADAGIGRDPVYLSINNQNMTVEATTDIKKAATFFIIIADSDNIVHDFHIVYNGINNSQRSRTLSRALSTFGLQASSLFYYLTTPLSFAGNNNGPIFLKEHAKKHETSYVLHSRLATRRAPPVPIDKWTQGQDGFFINCHGRVLSVDGYFALKTERSGYRPVVISRRDTSGRHLMVFRLEHVRSRWEEEMGSTRLATTEPVATAADEKRETIM